MCRRTRVRRVRRVRCSATSSSELCRDKVSSPKVREAVEGERVHKITFVGDNNEQTVVDCPEVRVACTTHIYSQQCACSFFTTAIDITRLSRIRFLPN